jgi:succinate dehydrogenase / fumarate reductase cytochrome b subunit
MAANNNRPLSPHLQIYKLPVTGVISITHRVTGMVLSAGLLFVVYLLSVLADGPEAYEAMQAVMRQGLMRVLFWGFIFALFIHFCHGIRHLIWDAGKSFDRETLTRYAILELIASMALTLLTFVLVK